MIGTKFKQPGEQLDYDVDFTDRVTDGDTIISATAEVSGDGLTVVSIIVSPDGLFVKVWLAEGVNGMTYKITVKASTTQGRILEEDFKIRVRDC